MGEAADMMLDGTLCQGCGVYLHGDGNGEPRCCRDCKRSWLPTVHDQLRSGDTKTSCKVCSRRVKIAGLAAHMRALHPVERVPKLKCPVCARPVKGVGMADHMRVMHPEVRDGSS